MPDNLWGVKEIVFAGYSEKYNHFKISVSFTNVQGADKVGATASIDNAVYSSNNNLKAASYTKQRLQSAAMMRRTTALLMALPRRQELYGQAKRRHDLSCWQYRDF